MKTLTELRTLLGWTASPEPEFLRFKAAAGVLPPLPPGSTNAPMLADLLKKDPKQVSWDEIQAGKIALVAIMPLEMLQARFGSLADEYETVTGAKPFMHGTFPNPPKKEEEWRAGVLSLIEDLAKFRRAKLMFERVRSMMGLSFGLFLFALVLSWGIYAPVFSGDKTLGTHTLWQPILFAGLTGAGFSVLSRLFFGLDASAHRADRRPAGFEKGLGDQLHIVPRGRCDRGGCHLSSLHFGAVKGRSFPGVQRGGRSIWSCLHTFHGLRTGRRGRRGETAGVGLHRRLRGTSGAG